MNTDDNIDEHRKSVLEKRQKCMDKVEENFPGRWKILNVCLAARAILEIKSITLPFMLVILGPPSAGKTTILRMIESLPNAFTVDSFTAKSFVSHYAGKKKEDLERDDIMTQIKDKIFLVLDLAPTFSVNEESLGEIIGILTSVLDGRGYKKSSGVYGVRGYGPTFFVLIGAAVDVAKKIWALIAQLGPKMFFLRMDMQISYEEEQQKILDNMNGVEYEQKLKEVNECLKEYWDAVKLLLAPEGGKIVWNTAMDQPGILLSITKYGQILARLRGHVPTDRTEGTGGSNYGYMEPTIEDAERATRYLYNLARGNAVWHGRNYVTEDDLSVIRSIVLSSAAKERCELLKMLIRNNGQVTSAEFMQQRMVSRSTVLKTMKQLEVLGLVDEITVPGTTKDFKAIRLKDHFMWILENKQNE